MKILLLLASLTLSSCSVVSYRLPEISAKSIEYVRTDPLGGTTVSAKDVVVNEDTVTASEAVWDTKYPAVTIRVKVNGYERKRTAPPDPFSPNQKPIIAQSK